MKMIIRVSRSATTVTLLSFFRNTFSNQSAPFFFSKYAREM